MDFSMNYLLSSSRPECELPKSISPISPVTECRVDSVIKPVPVENKDKGYIKQEEGNDNEIRNTSSNDRISETLSNDQVKVEGANPGEMISSHFLEPQCAISENVNMVQENHSHFNRALGSAINDQKYRRLTYLENNGRIFPGIELSLHGQPTQRGQIHPAAWKHPPSADRLIPFLCKQTGFDNQFNFSDAGDFYSQKVTEFVIPENSNNSPSSVLDSVRVKLEKEDEKKQALGEKILDKDYLDKQRFEAGNGKHMYQCPECPYTTPYRANLKVHIMVHTGNKPYGCAQCEFKTTTSSNLKKHMREHTGERPYKCYECESTFKTTGALKTHMMNHTGEKPFACPECDYKSTKSVNLKRHIMTHTGEKKYACTQCEYMCTGKKDLGRHMMTHTGEKPYSCPECDYACIQKETLKKHILTHTGERPFKCSQCTAGFRACGDLKRHMLVHTGEKPFACSACDYKCNKEVNLKRHMLTHTGEKPYTCPYCEYKCTENRLLKKHVMGHMNADGTFPERINEGNVEVLSQFPSNLHFMGHMNADGTFPSNYSTENIEDFSNLPSNIYVDNNDTSPADYMNPLGILPVDS